MIVIFRMSRLVFSVSRLTIKRGLLSSPNSITAPFGSLHRVSELIEEVTRHARIACGESTARILGMTRGDIAGTIVSSAGESTMVERDTYQATGTNSRLKLGLTALNSSSMVAKSIIIITACACIYKVLKYVHYTWTGIRKVNKQVICYIYDIDYYKEQYYHA